MLAFFLRCHGYAQALVDQISFSRCHLRRRCFPIWIPLRTSSSRPMQSGTLCAIQASLCYRGLPRAFVTSSAMTARRESRLPVHKLVFDPFRSRFDKAPDALLLAKRTKLVSHCGRASVAQGRNLLGGVPRTRTSATVRVRADCLRRSARTKACDRRHCRCPIVGAMPMPRFPSFSGCSAFHVQEPLRSSRVTGSGKSWSMTSMRTVSTASFNARPGFRSAPAARG